jgi:signal transduction histidine kinase
MQQVLLNLIARKPEIRRLTIVSGREDDIVPGNDHAERDRIFAAQLTTRTNGLGMGLPISRSSFRFHRGRPTITSRQDHGSAFRVIMPAQTESGL